MKKNVVKIVRSTLYYISIIFLLFLVVVSVMIPNGLVKTIGVGWYRVVSNSMEPIIMTGDYILVLRDQNVDAFEDGDIIVFETYFLVPGINMYQKEVVTHHFYRVDEDGFIITYPHSQYGLSPSERQYDSWRKGPGTPYDVTVDDVLGRHLTTIPSSGIFGFILSPYGLLVIVVNVGLIYGLIYFFKKDGKKKELEVSEEEVTDAVNEDKDHDVE